MMMPSLSVPRLLNSFRSQKNKKFREKTMPYYTKQCPWYISLNIDLHKSILFRLLRESITTLYHLMHAVLLRPTRHAAVSVHTESVVALVANRRHTKSATVLASDP